MEEEGEEEKKSTASETPAGPAEPAADEPGTFVGPVRFYDCFICKRGFTTAQALGGHMNIHRKDRARLRPTGPSTSGPRKGEEAYHPYLRAQHPASKPAATEQPYAVYFPSSSTEMVRAGEELRLGLGGSGQKEEEKEKGKKKEEEDLDLDLELRLGHSSKSHESSSDL